MRLAAREASSADGSRVSLQVLPSCWMVSAMVAEG
jgi:hypothetical protein